MIDNRPVRSTSVKAWIPHEDGLSLIGAVPPGVTLEGASTRVTHVPDFHARIE